MDNVKILRSDTITVKTDNVMWMCGRHKDQLYLSFCWNIEHSNTEICLDNCHWLQHPIINDTKIRKVTHVNYKDMDENCIMSKWENMSNLLAADKVLELIIQAEIKFMEKSIILRSPVLNLNLMRCKIRSKGFKIPTALNDNICSLCYTNVSNIITLLNGKNAKMCCECFKDCDLSCDLISGNLSMSLML